MASPTKVVLLACGSYNPITIMHLRMFEIARDALHRTGRYKVIGGIISPVNDNYAKKDLLPAKHRCAMVKLALKGNDWIKLDTWESEQDTWLETLKVLQHHRQRLDQSATAHLNNTISPNKRRRIRRTDPATVALDEVDYMIPPDKNSNTSSSIGLKLLCGADLLESFAVPGLWRDEHMEEIVSRYGMVCITRAGSNPEKFIYESDVLYRNQNNINLVTEWITNDISATKIRRALRRGESVKYLVQEPVIEYICSHKLYGAGDNKTMCHMYPSPNGDAPDFAAVPEVQLLEPGANYIQPNEIANQPWPPRQLSSQQPDNDTPPHSPRRPVTCMGADVTNLVRRVRNMKVALTPETCV